MADANINHQTARDYWQGIDADVNGMLGGFPYVSRVDLQGSKNFLAKLGIGGRTGKKAGRAVDCGAGIGRITEGLLLSVSETVDIVEPIAKFSDNLRGKAGIGEIFNVGLEDWSPASDDEQRYDLIWNQWCLGHLTDIQLVEYLQKCGRAVSKDGWVIVKENLSTNEGDVFDELDSSVTRLDKKFQELFSEAKLKIHKMEVQRGFPDELLPVKIYALRPQA